MSSSVIKVALAHLTVIIGSGLSKAIAFATSIILARVLGTYNFGQISLFTVTMLITWQVPQAFDTAFIRYVKATDDKDDLYQYLRASTRLKCIFSFLTIIAAWPAAILVDAFSTEVTSHGYLVGVGMICGSMLSFVSSLANILRVREQFAKYSTVQGCYNLAIFIAVAFIAYVLKVANIQNVLLVYIIVAFLFGVSSIVIVIKFSGNPFKASAEAKNNIFHFGKWMFLVAVAFYLAFRIDVLTLPYFIPYNEVGIYSAALQLVLVIGMLNSSMSTVFMPRSIKAVQSHENMLGYFKEAIIPISIVLGAIAFLYIIAPFCFKLLFPPEYAPATEIFRILLIGQCFQALYLPFSFLYYAIDRTDIRCVLDYAKLAFMFGLLLLFIPKNGMIGAAQAMSLAMAINCFTGIALFFFLLKRTAKNTTQSSKT